MSQPRLGRHKGEKGVLVPQSIEKRMELLESRFTTPSGKAAVPSSQDTTVNPNSPSASHHSFGFDPPSSSASVSLGGASSQTLSSASQLDKSLVRPKRKARRSSLPLVALAAEKQMQKVLAASSPLCLSVGNQTSMSGLPSPPFSNPSQSNQTVQTGHVTLATNAKTPCVVGESPPSIVTPVIVMNAMSEAPENPPPTKKLNNDKRKSVPVKRPEPTVTEKKGEGRFESTPKKRTRLNFAAGADPSRSPHHLIGEHLNTSRDRSNPSKRLKTKPSAVVNNTRIQDFFMAVKKGAITAPKTPEEEGQREQHQIAELRQRCEELTKLCQDKDEQLKAVSNNQTIKHTALRTALSEREKELEGLRKSNENYASKVSRVMEKLVRSDSERATKELRQKLAADGARLGRIVYTRAGMRAVESWEEGHAARLLQKRKSELKAKRLLLEEREKSLLRPKDSGKEVADSTERALTEMEASEAVRMHLSTLRREEVTLMEDEHALNQEKVEHIRSLKRVASEDDSRFRSRPKLHNRYVLLSLLGKGGFSEVWRAFDLRGLREVAVKIHQLDSRWSDSKKDNYTKHVSREYEIHRGVRHPRIVSLYDIFEIDNNSFATVLEYCKGTDLDSMLKERRRLSERSARALLLQILSGMNYLSRPSGSRQGIIHYDLKPANILFDEHGDVKITDFGLSKIVDTQDSAESMELTSQGAGTYWYLPPECFIVDETVRISNKVDVWSIGVIFYQMLIGKRPFGEGMSQDKVLTDNTMLNAREVNFPDKSSISDEAKGFIRKCLTYDQAFRPTIQQLCQHPYVLTQYADS